MRRAGSAAAVFPDLILMDLSMPSFNGIEATGNLRSLPEFSNTPMIGVTSHEEHYPRRALEAGCDEVAEKESLMQNMVAVAGK